DRQIEHVPAGDEFLEALKHGVFPCLVREWSEPPGPARSWILRFVGRRRISNGTFRRIVESLWPLCTAGSRLSRVAAQGTSTAATEPQPETADSPGASSGATATSVTGRSASAAGPSNPPGVPGARPAGTGSTRAARARYCGSVAGST